MNRKKLIVPAGALLILTLIAAIFWHDPFFTPDNWTQTIPDIGSSSSPRAIDLNASPLTFDFNEDGHDEAVVIINKKTKQQAGLTYLEIYVNEMLVYDPHNQNKYRFREQKTGSNLGSTPLLTDLDGDGYLDVIYCYMDDPFNFYSFKSFKIERIELKITLDQPVKWGEYMGPEYDGVYKE